MKYCIIMSAGRSGSTYLLSKLDGMDNTYAHIEEFNYLNAFIDLSKYGLITPKSRHNVNNKRNFDKNKINLKGKRLKKILNIHISNYNNAIERKAKNVNNFNLKFLNLDDFYNKELNINICDYHNFFFKKLLESNDLKNIHQIIFRNIETNMIDFFDKNINHLSIIHLIRSPFDYYNSIMGYNNDNSLNTSFFRLGGDSLIYPINNRWKLHAEKIINKSNLKSKTFIATFSSLFDNQNLKNSMVEFFQLENSNFFDNQSILGFEISEKQNSGLWTMDEKKEYKIKFRNDNLSYKKISIQEYELINFLLHDLLLKLDFNRSPIQSKTRLLISWILPKKFEILGTFNYYSLDIKKYKKFGVIKYNFKNPLKMIINLFLILFFFIFRRLLILKLIFKSN